MREGGERGLDEHLLVVVRDTVEPHLKELAALRRNELCAHLLDPARLLGEIGQHQLLARAVLTLALDEAEVQAHELRHSHIERRRRVWGEGTREAGRGGPA